MIEEGSPAPEFELKADSGETVKLSDLRGKQVVLYFYPKDDTTGCTTQACGIRDVYGEFEREGAVVLGVSPDDETSHVKFKNKYELPFTLLADEGHHVADEYGVWGEKKYMGRTYWACDALDLRDRRGRNDQEGDVQRQAGDARRRRARHAPQLEHAERRGDTGLRDGNERCAAHDRPRSGCEHLLTPRGLRALRPGERDDARPRAAAPPDRVRRILEQLQLPELAPVEQLEPDVVGDPAGK